MQQEQQNETRALTAVTERAPQKRRPRRRSFFAVVSEEYVTRTHKSEQLLFDLVAAVLAGFLAVTHAVFGVYPFALALLCAAQGRVLWIYAGAAVGCWFLGAPGVLYLAVYTLALGARMWLSYPNRRRRLPESPALFRETGAERFSVCAFLSLGMALFELIETGFTAASALFALGSLFLAPLLCWLYLGVSLSGVEARQLFAKDEREAALFSRSRAEAAWCQVGALVLIYSAALAFSKVTFFGISVGTCLSAACVLFVSRRYGALRGCATGLAAGLAGPVALVPAFALLGLMFGLCAGAGMPCALAAAVVGGAGWAAYAGGLSGFLAVAPEFAVTSLVAWPALKGLSRVRLYPSPPPGEERADPGGPSPVSDPYEGALAAAFSSLSRTLRETAKEEKTPEKEERAAICRKIEEKYCHKCKEDVTKCGEKVGEALVTVAAKLSADGDFPTAIPEREDCAAYPHMIRELRAEWERRRGDGGRQNANDLFSADYALFAKVLEEAGKRRVAEAGENAALSSRLSEKLEEIGIGVRRVRVYGERRHRIELENVVWDGGDRDRAERLHAVCEEVCGRGLSPARMVYNGKNISYSLESCEHFRVARGMATLPGGEEPSGDVCRGFESDSVAYLMLSDGMGSGPAAARTASLAVTFFEQLLSAGCRRQTALGMLNHLICSGGEECSATVDLCSVDLCSGAVSFLKSGAAASFVLRGDTLYRIRARTVPVGLLPTPDAEQAGMEVEAGDLVILVSDGVLRSDDDGAWLRPLLDASRGDPDTLAARILAVAASMADTPDDRTVAVLEIRDAIAAERAAEKAAEDVRAAV